MSVGCALLPWDTEFFGVRIGRVEARRLVAADLPGILDWIAREHVDCLYLLADSDDPATVRVAEVAGFRQVGIRVVLDCRLPSPLGAPVAAPGAAVRIAVAGDREPLKTIARASYDDTRFFADPGFSRDLAGELYARWVERSSYEGYSDAAFVATREDRAVGFLTASVKDGNGVIDLLGVDAAERGRGHGRLLVEHTLRWFVEQGCATASVVTQGRNIGAQRLYQQSGFRTSQVHLWYHRWSTPH